MCLSRKLLWLSIAALPVVIVAAALCWPRTPALPPQTLKMPDGTVYEFVGVTYGTNHVLGSLPARIVHRLPAFLADAARKILGPRVTQVDGARTTTQPSLLVWFRVNASNTSARLTSLYLVHAKIADEHDVESGAQAYVSFQGGFSSVGDFPVLPRRSRMLQLSIYEANVQGEIQREIGRIKFPNPLFGKFPQWQPDTSPAVRKAGDLEVRLDNFFVGKRLAGVPVWTGSGTLGPDYRTAEWGERAETVFDFTLKSPEGINGPWRLKNARLSDATGNFMDSTAISGSASTVGWSFGLTPGISGGRISLTAALWPDESAWKLKLEFKRASGFASNELVTFKQVPVPKLGTTNWPNLTVRVGDVQLVLKQFIRAAANSRAARWRFGRPVETEIRVELPGHPEGVAVDFIRMTTAAQRSRDEGLAKADDAGDELQPTGNEWMPGVRVISLSAISTNAQTADITFAVQKTREVEFLLKPPK